jgi:hypothetical protein
VARRTWLQDAADQARDFLALLPLCCNERGYVYVVQSGDLVKIGKSESDLVLRMKGLQAGSPLKIELLALGRGARFESTFHMWFGGSRQHGEWFTASTVVRWLRKPWQADHCLCCELAWRPNELRAANE